MSTELAISSGDSVGAIEKTLAGFASMGASRLLPKGVTSPADATILAMFGARWGWGPMQSIYNCHVIDGKPSMSSSAMLGVVMARPECMYFDLIESTDKVATFETQREGSKRPTRMSYTVEQARRAGLLNRGPWKQHTEDMLRHRCASKLIRVVYPDVFSGVYTPDEVRDFRNEPVRDVRSTEAPPAVEPEPIEDAEVVDEREPDEAKPKVTPMSIETFRAECQKRGVSWALVQAWRTARKTEAGKKDAGWEGKAAGFRAAGAIALLDKASEQLDFAAWVAATYPTPTEEQMSSLFPMVDGLTMGEAGRVRDKMDGDTEGAWAVMGGVIERLQKGGE